MKPLALAVILPTLLASATASASPYQLVFDPSGAPMCADAGGELAPLSSCTERVDVDDSDYALRADPSGAPMCFAANGEAAPLAMCEDAETRAAAARNRLAADPSGAPICFAANGEVAPIQDCQNRGLIGLWAGLHLLSLR